MASAPLLSTKLHLPTLRPGLVSRPRLIERLNDNAGQVTLISAPAGFGKTTLLVEWLATCRRPAGWLSLDSRDNDPLRFWSYFVAALSEVAPPAGEAASQLLQSSQDFDIQATLIHLINAAAALESEFVLILDDYQFIENRAIHDSVAYLIDHLPTQFHLVIASRTDPPWPLAHWRLRKQLVEVRMGDLRFQPDEAAHLLNNVMNLAIPFDDVLALEKRTEGWIAGLQMVALSLQGQPDRRKFIARFTGSNRYIFDYLLEEVLAQQPAEIREFLLKTSVLEQMTAPLCEAVTGNRASQSILIQLEQANLFIIPLDDERRWYRYHHLFMDLLRNQLKQEAPGELPDLYRRASSWFQEQHSIAEALRYALAAKDIERVARMAAQNAFTMVESGELGAVVQWLDTLPRDVFTANPWLRLAHAWALELHGAFDRAEDCLQQAEREAAHQQDTAGTDHILGHVAILRAFRFAMLGNMDRTAGLVQEGLRLLPPGDLAARGFGYSILSNYKMLIGELHQAVQLMQQAIELNRDAGNTFVVVDGLGDLARQYVFLGKLHLAAAACRDAFQFAEEVAQVEGRLPVLGFVHGILGDIYREWNQLDVALHYTREGVALCRQSGQTINLMHSVRYLSRTLASLGNTAGALEIIAQMRAKDPVTAHWNNAWNAAFEVIIHLKAGHLDQAAAWAASSGLSSDDEAAFPRVFYHVIFCRSLGAQGRYSEAVGLLQRIQQLLEAAGHTGRLVEVLALQARLLELSGNREQALVCLEGALQLAAPEGYIRIFIEEGEPLRALLREVPASTGSYEYATSLLSEFYKEDNRLQKDTPPASRAPARPAHAQLLIEPLTERELEVLRLLKTSLNTVEIAAELVISVTTVRTHIKNIYSKLNVNRRMEAIDLAEELKLL